MFYRRHPQSAIDNIGHLLNRSRAAPMSAKGSEKQKKEDVEREKKEMLEALLTSDTTNIHNLSSSEERPRAQDESSPLLAST